MTNDRKYLEVIFLLIGGVGVPVIASLFLPALPEDARVPVGIGIGSLVLVVGVILLVRHLRREIQNAAAQLLASLEGYNVDPESGRLFKGNIRNASLRITTIHDLVDNILAAVPEAERDRVLYAAGYQTGASWGPEFEAECRRAEMAKDALDEKLELWARYDASAGMGRLHFNVSDDGFGQVTLENSFLSDADANHPLNHWFSGYIAGTLYDVLDRRVEVELETPSPDRQRRTEFRVTPASGDHPHPDPRSQ
jgi:hypothetical protein